MGLRATMPSFSSSVRLVKEPASTHTSDWEGGREGNHVSLEARGELTSGGVLPGGGVLPKVVMPTDPTEPADCMPSDRPSETMLERRLAGMSNEADLALGGDSGSGKSTGVTRFT